MILAFATYLSPSGFSLKAYYWLVVVELKGFVLAILEFGSTVKGLKITELPFEVSFAYG